jgi:hypothetical protein
MLSCDYMVQELLCSQTVKVQARNLLKHLNGCQEINIRMDVVIRKHHTICALSHHKTPMDNNFLKAYL